MTSFLHLDMQDYKEEDSIPNQHKICICCASETDDFINYGTCKHTEFLTNNIKHQLDAKSTYFCVVCHNMLVNIEAFKQKIQESVDLLMNQAPILKINKLQKSSTDITDLEKPESDIQVQIDIKPEPEQEFDDQIKIENDIDTSDYETELPLASLKIKKPKQKSNTEYKYGGKIKIVVLSKTELLEEREALAKKENYLKLPYKCEHCIIGFDHELTLVNHMEKRHRKTKNCFECDVCKSVLSSKMSFNEHTKRHFRRFECIVCLRRYSDLQTAIQHYDEQHATEGETIQRTYTCKLCEYTTTSNRGYRYHMDKHKNKKECKICGNTFVNSNGLKVHMYIVHGESSRVYTCDICNKSYKTRSGLHGHSHAHKTNTPRAYCVVCKTHYRSEQGLIHHMNTHSAHVSENDKRFICDECGARFVKKSSLQVHINWEHLKIQTHRCTKCSKVFKSGAALKRHINYVHNKKRPPRNKICDYCGRAFTTQTILQSHIRTHTGERPLQCTHCPATFAHSAALYTHNKLLHTNK